MNTDTSYLYLHLYLCASFPTCFDKMKLYFYCINKIYLFSIFVLCSLFFNAFRRKKMRFCMRIAVRWQQAGSLRRFQYYVHPFVYMYWCVYISVYLSIRPSVCLCANNPNGRRSFCPSVLKYLCVRKLFFKQNVLTTSFRFFFYRHW